MTTSIRFLGSHTIPFRPSGVNRAPLYIFGPMSYNMRKRLERLAVEMPRYAIDFITQVVLRADFVPGTAPITGPLPEGVTAALEGYPERVLLNRPRTEVRVQKTPQGPVRDTRTIQITEHNFWTQGREAHAAVSSEYIYLSRRRYEGYAAVREAFLELSEAMGESFPGLRIRRLGMRYVNEIKLPEADAGPGLGAEFWEHYVNPLLVGGLRFAANDGALARHMCTTELNYGADRATIRYGIFNGEYPRPNRRREFILDTDTYCQTPMDPAGVAAKVDDYHAAACQVFEAAVTDALRARMNRP